MVMGLRVLWMWLTRRRRGRLDVLGVGKLPQIVWPNDLDLNMHMNNGRYFSVADIGRMDWWVRTLMWKNAMARGWRPMAGDANARFSKALLVFERYELHSRLIGWNGKWMFHEHRFMQGNNVTAVVVVRYLWHGEGKKQTPADVLALIGFTDASPPLPEWVVAWSDAQDALTADLKAARI